MILASTTIFLWIFQLILAQTVSQQTYDLLKFHARLSDIAYCVQPVNSPTQLRQPFECGVKCTNIEGVELFHSFVHKPGNTGFTGYFAFDHVNKTKYIVFRGTNSFEDTLVDFSMSHELPCETPFFLENLCPECKVQSSLLEVYGLFLEQHVTPLWDFVYTFYPDYSISVTGHSLGGVAAAFLATHLRVQGLEPVLVTFGQPRYGNLAHAEFIEKIFLTSQRRLYRVTHWNDVFVSLPSSEQFSHFSGEIYISHPWVDPPLETVRYCEGRESETCHAGDYNPVERVTFLKNHLAYFIWVGYCPYR
uniref:triacylglycerol lipase n=1 Tax=Yarrowia phangngaensis TaxID=444778 RepID=A0A078BMY7_9ASCO|nr:lipase [Yarrowia phangngaensis]